MTTQMANAFASALAIGKPVAETNPEARVSYELSVSQVSQNLANVEATMDENEYRIGQLNKQIVGLEESGERAQPVEDWAIFMDGTLMRKGYPSKEQAEDMLECAIGELGYKAMNDHIAYTEDCVIGHCQRYAKIKLIKVWPVSKWITKLRVTRNGLLEHQERLTATHENLSLACKAAAS